jgi:aryl-alcohol dehydrogenase (NADP+)
LLAGAELKLTDQVLDRIDQIVPPGSNSGPLGANYESPAIAKAALRRRATAERAAAASGF